MNRLMSKATEKNGCLVWTGAHNDDGYGRFWYEGKMWLTHRLVWTLQNGGIPNGMHVLHHCDNPSCIRINHLFLGSNADNVADKVSKNRQARNHKTHCKNGHEYLEGTTFVRRQGWKECRICIRANQKAARDKRKASI